MKALLIGFGKINKIIYKILNENVVGVIEESDYFINDIPDIIIDFSHPSSLDKTIHYAIKYKCPILIGTTGYSEEKMAQLEELSKRIPILLSENFSKGISLIKEFINYNTIDLNIYKKYIIETHNINKKDSPSGTAIMLSKLLNTKEIVSNRTLEQNTIHELIFENNNEKITIKHEIINKEIFAFNAIECAKWLLNQKPNLYFMDDYSYEL